jgi:HEAT repeat protein
MADDKYSSLRALDAMQVRSLDGKREYVASLEARGDEQALSLLVECLCDESAFLRGLAERALARLGQRAAEALLPHLTQGLWFTRVSAARVLGELGAREALDGLVLLAVDPNRSVVEAAVAAIAQVAAAGHVVSVARAVHRAPDEVRERVLAAAQRGGGELADQLARTLGDRELMVASADEVVGETPSLPETHEGVEWELLTGRAANAAPGEPGAEAGEADEREPA